MAVNVVLRAVTVVENVHVDFSKYLGDVSKDSVHVVVSFAPHV